MKSSFQNGTMTAGKTEKPPSELKKGAIIEVIGETENDRSSSDTDYDEDDPIWKLAATVGSTL